MVSVHDRESAQEQAQSVIFRYVRSIDANDSAAVAEHFAEDGICTGGFGTITGRRDLISFYEAAWANDVAQRTHFVTNVVVEEANQERVAASAQFLMTTRAEGRVELGWGTYRFVLSPTNGLLAELSIAVDDSTPLVGGRA